MHGGGLLISKRREGERGTGLLPMLRCPVEISPRPLWPGRGNAYLKWYDVHHTELAVAPEVREEARGFLRAEAAAGRLDLRNELGL
ncbi:hypothetical protein QFZ67_000201 [Streptomyces sp. V1I1]|nr:hypothetical protein [Streptomyces sp. V1I1]